MLNEIKLENFRGFRSLELKELKRVNLIVGQNNAGKTSLLEALFLACDPIRFGLVSECFRTRQGDVNIRYFPWLLRDGPPKTTARISGRFKAGANTIEMGKGGEISPTVGRQIYRTERLEAYQTSDGPKASCRVISIWNRDANELVKLVGMAQRKKQGEEKLERLLKIVDPRINKIRVDPGDRDGNQVIVDIGLSELVPITQAGQGVYRLVTILADIIGDTPQVLLIDEIENGLHHSVHKQVWTGLAETAALLNVQIFATTHSDECLHAAHQSFSERSEYDFGVIQLFRVESGVQGRILDRKHIEAALAGDIELR